MRRKIAIFDILGVRPEDDISKIRLAWRRTVKTLHPDVAQDKAKAGDMLARVNAAFDSLKSHTPFAERRRGDRRKTWRSGRVWSHAERSRKLAAAEQACRAAAARQRAEAEAEAAKRQSAAKAAWRRAQAEALARRNAAELERKEAAKRAAIQARRATAPAPLSKAEQAMRMAARSGYQSARGALAV